MANIKQILGFGSDTDDYEDDVEYEEEATEEKSGFEARIKGFSQFRARAFRKKTEFYSLQTRR